MEGEVSLNYEYFMFAIDYFRKFFLDIVSIL